MQLVDNFTAAVASELFTIGEPMTLYHQPVELYHVDIQTADGGVMTSVAISLYEKEHRSVDQLREILVPRFQEAGRALAELIVRDCQFATEVRNYRALPWYKRWWKAIRGETPWIPKPI